VKGSAPCGVDPIARRSVLARKQRRRRRGGATGKPLRLGVVLVGLVGVNVYVFFFNHGTAPREILNMQSTSKTFDSNRQEALSADVRRAGELVASSSTPKAAAKSESKSASAHDSRSDRFEHTFIGNKSGVDKRQCQSGDV